ncbi:MAG TPA: hypothetical protein VNT60_10745 [Deinococcales bacterium]|nr:hypothetical protein [Deinococcales bacterium]
MHTDPAARLLGECRTRDEALKRLASFAKEQRKELVASTSERGLFVLQGYQQRGGHDMRHGHAVRTYQRVLVEDSPEGCRILIWPESEQPA